MSVLADLFEQTQRMRRIQIWLDDIAGVADELAARTPDGELTSFADNEWLWNERGRASTARNYCSGKYGWKA